MVCWNRTCEPKRLKALDFATRSAGRAPKYGAIVDTWALATATASALLVPDFAAFALTEAGAFSGVVGRTEWARPVASRFVTRPLPPAFGVSTVRIFGLSAVAVVVAVVVAGALFARPGAVRLSETAPTARRSEERRVGKEGRCGRGAATGR